MKLANPSLILQYIIHTFRNGKEAKKYNTVAMCPSDVIVDVSNREIDWPILIVFCSYRYCKLKNSQATLPGGIASIVLYIVVAVKNGGSSLWMARDAAQRLSIKLISPADIWLRQKRKSATSNWRRLSNGVQSLGP